MDSFVLIIVALFIIAGLFKYLEIKYGKKEGKMPYFLSNSVFTKNEYNFYKILKPIADEREVIILPKIRIADFVYCKKDIKNYWTWFNKISKKHVDFLLCDKSLRPLLAIEVDDVSHDRLDRVERDKFVEAVYKHIGLDVMRVRNYNVESVRKEIYRHLKKEIIDYVNDI